MRCLNCYALGALSFLLATSSSWAQIAAQDPEHPKLESSSYLASYLIAGIFTVGILVVAFRRPTRPVEDPVERS